MVAASTREGLGAVPTRSQVVCARISKFHITSLSLIWRGIKLPVSPLYHVTGISSFSIIHLIALRGWGVSFAFVLNYNLLTTWSLQNKLFCSVVSSFSVMNNVHRIFYFFRKERDSLRVLYVWVRASWIEFDKCPTRCDLFSLLYFCRQLYTFRVLTPIIRSSYNCNYSFWYWLTGSTTILTQWVASCWTVIKINY